MISLTRAVLAMISRERSIMNLRVELSQVPSERCVSEDDNVHELLKKLLAKRAK